jgi:hypothetical protein
MRRTLYLLGLLLVVSGCDSSDAPDVSDLRAPDGRTPVAGAIEVRDDSNLLLGRLGSGPVSNGYLGTLTPEDCRSTPAPGEAPAPARFVLSSAYPNPTTRGVSTIELSVGCATPLSVFVVAALPPGGTPAPDGTLTSGGWSIRPGGFPVAVLHEGPVAAGVYRVELDFRNPEGRPLPPGYYRVYAQTPYVIAWTDVLYAPDFQP